MMTANIRKAEERVAAVGRQVAEIGRDVDAHRRILGDRLVDEQFFAKGHEVSNLASPWIPDSLHRKREDLFIAALAVHRAFIDASAQKVLHNLSVLMDVFSGGPPQDEEKRKLLGDLWSTRFMVVPVLSTTFASVERMLGDLLTGSIGWLLIDEAGQALPQAAVGAVMRAKRSIVVGDPLQIPPVVALPERLNADICNFFKIDKPVWAAPEASAQSMAIIRCNSLALVQSIRSTRKSPPCTPRGFKSIARQRWMIARPGFPPCGTSPSKGAASYSRRASSSAAGIIRRTTRPFKATRRKPC